MKVEETWVSVKMSLMKDKELYKRDWEIEGLVNFIGKHELCRLRGRAVWIRQKSMQSSLGLES